MTPPAVAAFSSPASAELYLETTERRAERSETPSSFVCDLWMIDHCGSTVLRCRCLESAPGRLRLSVPLGYGVAEGQHYELCAHPPGAGLRMPLALDDYRWVKVLQTHLCLGAVEDHLDVTVGLDPDQDAFAHSLAGPVS